MSEEHESSVTLEELERLMQEVQDHVLLPKEETLFGIGGKGYYEKPTSAILSYFMRPTGQHGFGPLFLRALFDCIEKNGAENLDFEGTQVEPEVYTRDGYWIDVLVKGPDWILIIENKIRHWLANPLSSYEEHARRCGPGKKLYRVVLSPNGEPPKDWPEWSALSYREYCRSLKLALAKDTFDCPLSKWHVFAREFIVHLEQEIYNTALPMTPRQIAFVEKNIRTMTQAKRLLERYQEAVLADLVECLRIKIPHLHFNAFIGGNGPECLSEPWSFGVKMLDHPTPTFKGLIWIKGLAPEKETWARTKLDARMDYHMRDSGWHGWITRENFSNRKLVIAELCEFAKELSAP